MNDTTPNLPAPIEERSEQRPIVRERIVVQDPIPVLDTGRFEQMQRVAAVMAASSLVPEALSHEGTKNDRQRLPQNVIVANCFLVVNQAVRWGMDPFAVAQCVSVVHGKLVYEGKLIAAVLDARFGIELNCEFEGQGENMKVTVYGVKNETGEIILDGKGNMKTVEGTVAQWKTTSSGSPWNPATYQRQLRYRGAREWARAHKPAILLGVYGDDEMEAMTENMRAARAHVVRDTLPPPPLQPTQDPPRALAPPSEKLPPPPPREQIAQPASAEPEPVQTQGKGLPPPPPRATSLPAPPPRESPSSPPPNAEWVKGIADKITAILKKNGPEDEAREALVKLQVEEIVPMKEKVVSAAFSHAMGMIRDAARELAEGQPA